MWNRFLLFFMQPSKYPSEPWTVYLKPKRVHLFTAIQLFLFVLMYTVKSISTVAIIFPMVIALCIPIRLYVLPRIFTEEELIMLDGDDGHIDEWLSKKEMETCDNDSVNNHHDHEGANDTTPPGQSMQGPSVQKDTDCRSDFVGGRTAALDVTPPDARNNHQWLYSSPRASSPTSATLAMDQASDTISMASSEGG
jgi:hypothetical protein